MKTRFYFVGYIVSLSQILKDKVLLEINISLMNDIIIGQIEFPVLNGYFYLDISRAI